ncbi:regulator [Bordetella genomosp. 6]|nr:regulator [Bordetella genomosp. 6]
MARRPARLHAGRAVAIDVNYSSWDTSRKFGAGWLLRTDLGRVRAYAEGQALYRQGDVHDSFFLVRSGFLHTVVHGANGGVLLLEIFGPEAIFGEASAFVDEPRYVTARAVTPAVVTEYRVSELLPVLASEPGLAVSLIQLLGIKHRILIGKLLRATSASPRERLEGLLGRIAAGSEETRSLRLTHEQLASMTGLSRVTVTRALKAMAEEGLVATRGKGVEIRDAGRLRERLGPF